MKKADIESYILLGEPAFDYAGKQYSVCSPDGKFHTWDSDGITLDFPDIDSLLSGWIVGGRPFKDIVDQVLT